MIGTDPDPARFRASRMLALAVVVLITAMLPSCSQGKTEARTDLMWPWWPNRMWISDITRVGRAGTDGVRPLEVRICFEDRDGDRTKASGELEIRVDRPTERDEPVVVLVDLDDDSEARERHERVTGSYLIPMEVDLPGLVAGRHLRIIAVYRGRDGAVLRDEFDIELQGPMRE